MSSDPTAQPVLTTAVKRYAHTAKIMSGELTVPGLHLNCLDIEPIHRAFAPMARQQAYDVSELAIATLLQAKAYGKPLLMLPVVLAARLQQGCLVFNRRHCPGLRVQDLAGARVGVRAYAQTIAASSSPSISICSMALPAGARRTKDGSRYSSRWPPSKVVHWTRSGAMP